MCTYDYLPTIVDMAGLDFKPKKNYFIDGKSMKQAVKGNAMVRDTTIFSAWMRLVENKYGRTLIGERYKLVIPEESGTPELYDLKNDPGEKVNIVAGNPEIAEAMLKELQAWEESCRLSRDGKDYTY